MAGQNRRIRLASSVAALVLLVGLAAPAAPVQANKQELQEMQSELDRIQREKAAAKNELAQAYYAAEEANAQLVQVESELAEANGRLTYVQNELTTASNKLAEAEVEVAAATERVEVRKGLVARRVRTIHENGGGINYMSMLFGATSFAEFVSSVDVLKLIVKQDSVMFSKLREEQVALEQRKEDAAYQRSQLARLAQMEEQNRNTIAAQREQVASVSRSLSDRKASLKGMYSQFEAQEERVRQYVAEIQARMAREAKGVFNPIAPVANFLITDTFGGRLHPILGVWKQHNGTDFAASSGTPVLAIDDGVVILAGWDDAYGNLIVVDHGGGVASWYGHSSALLVSAGETVAQGQQIAKAGSTGWSTGPHVHLEIHINGRAVNPQEYIQ